MIVNQYMDILWKHLDILLEYMQMLIFKLKFLNTDNKHYVKHLAWNFLFTCAVFGLHCCPLSFLHLKKLRLRAVLENTSVDATGQLGLSRVFL